MKMIFTLIKKVRLAFCCTLLTCTVQTNNYAQVADTIGFGTVATNNYGPMRFGAAAASSFSTKVISLYSESELAAAGIYPGTVINSIAWQKKAYGNLINGSSVNVTVSFRDQRPNYSYGTSITSTVLVDNYIGANFTAAGSKVFSATGNNLPVDSLVWVPVIFSSPFTYTGGGLEVLTNSLITQVAGAGNPTSALTSSGLTWLYTSNANTNSTMYTNNLTGYNNTTVVFNSNYKPNTIFNHTATAACAGTPIAGSISMDTLKACPGMISGNLVLTGASNAEGITVQWEKKELGQPGFTPIANANNYILFNQSVTTPTEFRVVVTCSGFGSVNTPGINLVPVSNITPNYAQQFNATATWNGNYLNGCWEGRKGLIDYPVDFLMQGTSFNAGIWASDGWNNTGTFGAARVRLTSSAYDWFLTPPIDLGIGGNYQMDFDLGVFTYNAPGAGTMDGDDNFMVVISTDGGATFTQANVIREINTSNTSFPLANSYMHVTIPLTAYSGVVKIGFYGTGGTMNPTPASLSPDVMIDNFQILPGGTVLPVKMGLLDANINRKEQGVLTWKTYTEENNAGFRIEKSKDAVTFRYLGKVASKTLDGNSKATLNYSFTDPEYNDGTVYYRFIQVDHDNNETYSNVAKLSFGQQQDGTIKVYPNPVTNEVNIIFNEALSDNAQITISDVTGKVKMIEKVMNKELKIDVRELPAGIYFMNIMDERGVTVHKLIKL